MEACRGWGAGGVRAGFVERRHCGAGSGRAGGRFQVQRLEAEGSGGASWSRGDLLSAAPPGSSSLFLCFLWRWQILRASAPAVYQGPPQAWGLPLPAAEAVRPWLRKQLRQGTPAEGRENPRRREQGAGQGQPGWGTGTNRAPCASRACPAPLHRGETQLHRSPLGWHLLCDSAHWSDGSWGRHWEWVPLLCSASKSTCCRWQTVSFRIKNESRSGWHLWSL